ncbi:MAG: hypothetical protein R6W93_14705, partial [Candidatus Limnocylindrales bacterium]
MAEHGRTVPRDRRSLWVRVRPRAGLIGTYILLVGIGIIFLFPFIFMITTSLKTSEEVFRYPPRLLPTEAQTATLAGEELPLYELPVAGETYQMVPVETGVRAGVFADPSAAAETVLWPLDLAVPVLDSGGEEVTAVVDGDELPLFDVALTSGTERLVKIRDTAVAKLVLPEDPSIV